MLPFISGYSAYATIEVALDGRIVEPAHRFGIARHPRPVYHVFALVACEHYSRSWFTSGQDGEKR